MPDFRCPSSPERLRPLTTGQDTHPRQNLGEGVSGHLGLNGPKPLVPSASDQPQGCETPRDSVRLFATRAGLALLESPIDPPCRPERRRDPCSSLIDPSLRSG